jgi:hypothetical protein
MFDGVELDRTLEELPGRFCAFTNKRIIIADSSYKSNVQQTDMKAAQDAFDHNGGWGDDGTARVVPREAPGGPSNFVTSNKCGWEKQELDDIEREKLLSRHPPSITEIDFRYYRSFPVSDVLDIRMDFVVAHSTHAQTFREHDSEATGTCF